MTVRRKDYAMISDDSSFLDEQGHVLDIVLDDLALGTQSAGTERHLVECPLCRIRLRRLVAVKEPQSDLEAVVRTRESLPSVPSGVLQVLSRRIETEPHPQELWLTVGPNVAMVWIRRIVGASAFVQAVVFDTEMADEYTLVLSVESNPFGLPLAVFCSFDAQVDLDKLDRLLFSLPIESAIDSLRSARRSGTTTPTELVVGPPVEDASDERHEFRQIVADRLVALETSVDADADPSIADFEERVESLCFRRQHCRKTPCDNAVSESAATSGWRALTILREVDPTVVVLLGSLDVESVPGARVIIDLANATAVAFVEDLDGFETRVYEATDLAERRYSAPSGKRLDTDTHVASLPFEDALFKYLDAMSMFDDGPAVRGAGETVSDDIDEIAQAEARSAVASAKAHAYRRLKGEAFKALDDSDANFIARVIKAGAAGEPVLDLLRTYSRSR